MLAAALAFTERPLLPVCSTKVVIVVTLKELPTKDVDTLLPMRFLPCRRLSSGCAIKFMADGGSPVLALGVQWGEGLPIPPINREGLAGRGYCSGGGRWWGGREFYSLAWPRTKYKRDKSSSLL